jgi:hypothetical protein
MKISWIRDEIIPDPQHWLAAAQVNSTYLVVVLSSLVELTRLAQLFHMLQNFSTLPAISIQHLLLQKLTPRNRNTNVNKSQIFAVSKVIKTQFGR